MSFDCFWTVVKFDLSIISYSHLTLNPAGAGGAQYLPTFPPSALHNLIPGPSNPTERTEPALGGTEPAPETIPAPRVWDP